MYNGGEPEKIHVWVTFQWLCNFVHFVHFVTPETNMMLQVNYTSIKK